MIATPKRIAKWVKFSVLGRRRGIRIGTGCNIGYHSVLEGRNVINSRTVFSGYLGFGSYVGRDCQISASIGRYCSISTEVRTVGGRHPVRGFVSTHPAFYSVKMQTGFSYVDRQMYEEFVWADPALRVSVVIGHDVLVGQGVRILEGVTVGHGAVLGAGCLVRSNVEPYAIYAGVPARKVGQRFDDKVVQRLLAIKWWDKGEDWIRRRAALFADVEAFLASGVE